MKKLLERITRRRAENQTKDAAPQETPEDGLPTEPEPGGTMEAAPKPPPELPLFFMLSHLDDDGPVRLDGVKLGVCEVMGLELDEPKLGAFAGALNALDFPTQLLIRQHPPRLDSLRENLQRAQPEDLPPQTRAAAESLRTGRGGDRPTRRARRQEPRPLPSPGQVAPVPCSRLPPRADGGGRADGPVRPPGADSHRAGGEDAGVAEGAVRVGPVPLLQARTHHVAGGGDRPGGRDPAPRRGAAGAGAALSCLSIHHPARQGRGCAQGHDPAGEGPLRRHPGQAGRPGLPAARGPVVHAAAGPERRGRVAHPGHLQHRPALPLLAPRPGHPQRDPLRHRHAGLRPGGLRPLGRDAPERQHRRPRTLRQRQVLRHQAGDAAGPVPGASPPTSSTPRASTRTWRGRRADGCSPPASPARA